MAASAHPNILCKYLIMTGRGFYHIFFVMASNSSALHTLGAQTDILSHARGTSIRPVPGLRLLLKTADTSYSFLVFRSRRQPRPLCLGQIFYVHQQTITTHPQMLTHSPY